MITKMMIMKKISTKMIKMMITATERPDIQIICIRHLQESFTFILLLQQGILHFYTLLRASVTLKVPRIDIKCRVRWQASSYQV